MAKWQSENLIIIQHVENQKNNVDKLYIKIGIYWLSVHFISGII
ncbi:MAG: hypothetical protein ACI9UT_003184 [Flavobacteriales bacterium]|jgi:hypothetical protein